MEKLKSLNNNVFLKVIKACLVGIIVTLVGLIVLALVLKFTDLPINVVNYINDAIKVVSLFVVVLILRRSSEGKLLFKALIAGLVYAVLSYVIFSILNGAFVLDFSVVYDLLFALVVSIIVAVIVNLTFKKSN